MLRCVVAVVMMLPAAVNANTCRPQWVAWQVKPNGKLTTRPAYTLTNGVLVKSKERAPVGATCDTSKPTKPSNKDLYASYDSTGTVALCSKR